MTLIKSSKSKNLENAVFISVILFIYKIVVPVNTSLLHLVINELLIFISVFAWVNYVSEFIDPKLSKPISLIINTGILNALVFFIISITSWLFSESNDSISSSNLIYVIFSTVIVFIFIGSLAYIFAVYKKLCFHRQKKEPILYFNTTVIFFFITSLSSSFFASSDSSISIGNILDSGTDFIYKASYAITISLIIIISLRVAWIAFLNKKQKIALLLISVVLSALSWINFSSFSKSEFFLISNFSPALEQLFSLVMIYGAIYFTVVFFTTLFHLPTAEAIDRKSEELTSVKDLSTMMSQVFDFEELSDTITSRTLKVSNSDAAWIAICENGEINLHSIVGLGIVEANTISQFLTNNKLLSLSELNVTDLTKFDKRYKLPKSIKSIVSAPLTIHNQSKGYLFAARKTIRLFEDEDTKPIGTFAGFAAVALENAKLVKESLEKERLERELDLAREVQYKILPQKNPVHKNLDITALFVPAFEVGGDYYDFFQITKDKIGVVVADVSGKGIEASFIMAEVKGIFTSLAALYPNPKDLLNVVNGVLKNSLERKTFVTATYGVIDFKKSTFKFARAGHAPTIYFNGSSIQRLVPKGIGLGLDFTNKFQESLKEMEIKLNNNDIITLFTDGISESLNENFEEYGYTRLESIIKQNIHSTADELSNKIMESVATFSKNNSQHDDITLVLFKWRDPQNLRENFNG